ncbi:hypothetical protein FY528_17360 [Hymenobacter lutimineralis]|uniref:Uncharacterized protein n=1 Tax=Hymenobacter lutimineralis TaxID=2606448 RepID=A0A5D6UU63_9BACT|nr:hypothetical protein [Hymenobacter lutimineralis]TYZ06637.1 hypothetical protein FY528_17360 [Hymenobacter lutimineralis]
MNYRPLFWLLPALLGACTPDTPSTQQPTPPPAPVGAAAAPAAADSLATFHWDTEMCTFTGRYDSRQYTAQQLTDTYDLLRGGQLTTSASVFKPADIAKLSVDTLEAEYTNVLAHIRKLQPVPGATWRELKRLKLQELNDEYRAIKLTILGYSNPSLLANSPYPAACKTYIRGLAAGNDSSIMASWQQLVREQQKNNSVPESLQARFEQESAAPNWHEYAQVELINFGWWNCINETIRRVEPTEKWQQQYEKLFSNVQSECEEVD